ncbi:InlB B-repeat-containing protein [Varibaculum cambriense]|uniref:Atypical Rib domain-containing protein n=1 Tax=Varibaculum cambriense TaxID=184870 RepID=A0ABX4US65_9ACTO|nr:InlB B-repeat-containing protein [Varibaculum cambriense]PMB91097.1 hypothetical protein CJ240_05230 [Varibaculum cambriense]
MLNFNNQPGTLSAEKTGGAIQRSASFLKRLLIVTLFCALSFMLSAPSLVQAEDLQEGTPTEQPSTNVQPVNTADPAKLITSAAPENKAPVKAHTQAADGLEIGSELIGQPVRQSTLPAPTIGKVFYDATTISGANVQRKRVGGKTVRSTVYVTLKDKNGNEKSTVSATPTSGTSWTVNLPNNIKVAAGDTVTAYQTLDGATSDVVTANAEPSKASENKDKLKMPTGEIWIEQTSSNQVSVDEHAEAIEMLKNANPDIAKDFKEVKFSIDGTDHAYYEVTYTDKSTSGKIEAKDLKIKTVTEKSAAPTIEKVQVTDRQIIVTLDKEVAAGTKFYFVKNFTDGEDKNFGEGGKCIVDKSTSQEMSQAVSVDGKKVTFPIKDDDIELGKEFGILVKEPHKFRSCAKSEPVVTTPKKVAVRDPHKLTDADKKAIDKAIRDANTVHGNSKLPDLFQGEPYPAIIEFDKDGNVTIISPNDVVVDDWDSNYNPVFAKNPDGTYKVKERVKVTKIDAKDLVKNIKPESPAIAVDTDKGEVTITPPAYEKAGEDTDLASYTITYNDASGAKKTVTLTRTVDATGKTTWTSDGATVDAKSGKVTLQIKDLAVGATITAKAKDKGGLEGDTDELESAPVSETLKTVEVTYNAGDGGKGTMTDGKLKDGKKLNKGSKYTLLESTFTAPDDTQEFKAWEVDGKEVPAGTEITVKDNTVVKAVWKKIKVNVTYDGNGGKGSMDGATVDKGSEYTVLPNGFTAPDDTQEFKAWEVDGQEVAPGAKITVKDNTVVKAIWKKIPVKVSYDANGGSGEMKPVTVDKGSEYTVLPNGFTAPDDTQEFKAWEVDGQEVAPGAKITVKDNTVVKAIWKDIEYQVTFDGNGGSGDMKGNTVKKGATVELPVNGFTPPSGKEFNGWQINGKSYKVGESITVNGDVTVKALWKDKPVPPSTTPGKDKPGTQGKSQPQNQLSRTGANGMYSLYASLLLLATGGLFVISRRRRAQR